MFKRAISLILTLSFGLQQTVFAYTASLNLSGYLNQGPNLTISDKFRPVNLRYFSYQPQTNDFKILLDKGDFAKGLSPQGTVPDQERLKEAAKQLMDYFKIGLSLSNDKFWVNLRPDSEDEIIDDELAKTDLGKVMLEADLKLKQDTALFTSPQTPQGKEYWNKLYKRAGELFGTENITIPTLTRPWIVPGEIILRESSDNNSKASQGAYIYKANLKVLLEEDYLKSSQLSAVSSQQYEFNDPRLKELNQYSTQLIRELILPKLTQKVNSSKDYANLRQVYFSLILARWFKETFSPQSIVHSPQNDSYIKMIDSHNLTNLTSKQAWDKTTYFNAYQKSFKEGEYNLSEPIYTPTGQVIRRYMSGGIGNLLPEAEKIRNGFAGRDENIVGSAIAPGDKISLNSSDLTDRTAQELKTAASAIEEFRKDLISILSELRDKGGLIIEYEYDGINNILNNPNTKQYILLLILNYLKGIRDDMLPYVGQLTPELDKIVTEIYNSEDTKNTFSSAERIKQAKQTIEEILYRNKILLNDQYVQGIQKMLDKKDAGFILYLATELRGILNDSYIEMPGDRVILTLIINDLKQIINDEKAEKTSRAIVVEGKVNSTDTMAGLLEQSKEIVNSLIKEMERENSNGNGNQAMTSLLVVLPNHLNEIDRVAVDAKPENAVKAIEETVKSLRENEPNLGVHLSLRSEIYHTTIPGLEAIIKILRESQGSGLDLVLDNKLAEEFNKFDQRLRDGDRAVLDEIVDFYKGIPYGNAKKMKFYKWLQNHQSALAAKAQLKVGLDWKMVVPELVAIAKGESSYGNPYSAARQLYELVSQKTLGGLTNVPQEVIREAEKAWQENPGLTHFLAPVTLPAFPMVKESKKPGYLVIVRHGQASFSEDVYNRWAGWLNSLITAKGREEARAGGAKLYGVRFDEAYSSDLLRAVDTLDEFLTGIGQTAIRRKETKALREKNYGWLGGQSRKDIEELFGKEQFTQWRRAINGRVPLGESLADTKERTGKYILEEILPAIAAGKNVVISAHGNSLRSLLVILREHTLGRTLNDEEIIKLEVPNSVPIAIKFDKQLKHKEMWSNQHSPEEILAFLQSGSPLTVEDLKKIEWKNVLFDRLEEIFKERLKKIDEYHGKLFVMENLQDPFIMARYDKQKIGVIEKAVEAARLYWEAPSEIEKANRKELRNFLTGSLDSYCQKILSEIKEAFSDSRLKFFSNDVSTATADLKKKRNFLLKQINEIEAYYFGKKGPDTDYRSAFSMPGRLNWAIRIHKMIQDEVSLNNILAQSVPNSSSAMMSQDLTGGTTGKSEKVVGGIDFRQMNMLIQPQGSFASSSLDFSLPALSRAEIESFDLDKELSAIQKMASSGIAPSDERLKEYLAVCFAKERTGKEIDSLKLCLLDIFERQQFEAKETPNGYKEVLVIADTRGYVLKEGRLAASGQKSYSLN